MKRLVLPLWLACSVLACDTRPVALPEQLGTEAPSAGGATTMNEKESRTAAQVKLDSHIVLALKKSRGEPPFDKPTQLDPDLAIEADGRVLVDLKAAISKELLAHLESEGGKVINSFEAAHAMRALVPLQRMEALAARADVQFISPAAQATTNNRSAAQAQGPAIKP